MPVGVKKKKNQMALVSCNLIFFLLNIFIAYIDYISCVISLLSFRNSCQLFFTKYGMRVNGLQPGT